MQQADKKYDYMHNFSQKTQKEEIGLDAKIILKSIFRKQLVSSSWG